MEEFDREIKDTNTVDEVARNKKILEDKIDTNELINAFFEKMLKIENKISKLEERIKKLEMKGNE
jgi:hypothetical protein